MSIQRILVANRGEIARRVFSTARRLGIGTVAVYSDADAGLPFVAEADLAVRLPGTESNRNSPAETYLRGDLIIEAAKKAGADAIHPGYGFLSENAEFARAVEAAGLTWIGPTAESIDSMGSKIAAKKLMADAGVPVFGEIEPAAATEADLPLLVKASAGGGGRGMRIVRDLADLPSQVQLASDEAASAFGDATVFCEPYLENGRHVEVQVVGDSQGNVLVLGERDCSLQRRHQKVVEEAPAPGLSDEVRRTLHEGARLAASAIGYVGAGTVEFMVSTSSTNGDSKVSFLEMNTRLQVEHPVTEAVFGIDLVEAQIRVAEGGAVPKAPSDPRGHAVEVRLYAEDPAADYQPQSGVLDTFEIGCEAEFTPFLTYGSRLDSGFVSGSEVGTHYDAMLAKVIVWGPSRDAAFRTLAGILERSKIHGLVTNRDLLVRLLRDPDVLAGKVTTDFLGSFDLAGQAGDSTVAAQAAAIALAERDRAARTVQQGIPVAWRNVISQPQRTALEPLAGGDEIAIDWYGGREGYSFPNDSAETSVLSASPEEVVLEVDGVRVAHSVRINGDAVHVDSGRGSASFRVVPRFIDPSEQVSAGSLLAPMPGTVIAVSAESGAMVEAGQTLIVLEAMKMQHSISAPGDGVVEIAVQVGQQVSAGDVLAVVSTSSTDGSSESEGEQA